MLFDQVAEETFECVMRPSGTPPREFETQHVHTCRNTEELASADDSGQTDVIRMSVIDWRSPRFAIRKSADGTFTTALRTMGAATSVGARGIR